MIIAIGVLLIGGHLLLVMALANVFAASFGNWSTLGLMVLMGFAIYSGLWILKFQTWLEGYFIRRHIKRSPNSGWRVVAQPKVQKIIAKPPRRNGQQRRDKRSRSVRLLADQPKPLTSKKPTAPAQAPLGVAIRAKRAVKA